MVTVRDIARHCGVSPGTVSNILNGRGEVSEHTRRKVMAYVKETGYRRNYFARGEHSPNTDRRIIGIITEGLGALGSNQIVESVMEHCDEYGYRSGLVNMGLYVKYKDTWFDNAELLFDAAEPALQEAQALGVSGIIYVAGHHRVIDCFPQDFPLPAVVVYGLSKDARYPSIVIDDDAAGYATAKYLLDKGHRNIGVIAGRRDNHHTVHRLRGFERALEDEGVLLDSSTTYFGDWQRSAGYQGAKVLTDAKVSAIFSMSDEMAAGVYEYCYENGLVVGRDISVVGFDNTDVSGLVRPRLTTNEIAFWEIGSRATEVMMGLLEEEDGGSAVGARDGGEGGSEGGTASSEGTPSEPAPVYRIACNLIERESVAALG